MDQITNPTQLEREYHSEGAPQPRRRTWRTAAIGVLVRAGASKDGPDTRAVSALIRRIANESTFHVKLEAIQGLGAGFVPKVLDRAFVFEFRVSTEELASGMPRPSAISAADPALLVSLLSIGRDDRWHEAHPHPAHQELV